MELTKEDREELEKTVVRVLARMGIARTPATLVVRDYPYPITPHVCHNARGGTRCDICFDLVDKKEGE